MKKKALLSFVLVICFLAGALSGCGDSSKDAAVGAEQGIKNEDNNEGQTAQVASDIKSIIRFGRDWPTYADPGVGSSYTCQIAHANLYSPLVFPNTEGTVDPHVATEWHASEDGLTYTFKLRDDVKFHSGNILKASDVAFSMNRLLTIGEGFSHLYVDVVAECIAEDDTTVVFKLKNTFGPFVNSLTRFFVLEEAVVREHIDSGEESYGEFGDYGKKWLLTNDAGSGPYKIKEFKLDEFLMGEKFNDYFLGWEENAPEYFMISNLTDPVAQRTAFANNEMEISGDSLPQETYSELEKMGGVIAKKTSAGGWNMFLNTKSAPTDCPYFRKAMAYAFDYDTLTTTIIPGAARATGPVSSALFGKNTELPGYTYDLEKAKEMLSKSKYADQPEMWVVDMAWCAEVPEQEKISLMFQAGLKELGIDLQITKTPFSVMTANAQSIETTPNASIVQWSPNFFEAGDVFKSRYHSKSTGSWEQMEWLLDEKLDAMIDESLSIIDDAERAKAYAEIEAYIYDLSPTIWMCRNDAKFAVQPYVEWPLLTCYLEGKSVIFTGGYDMFYHDFKIFTDQIAK